MTQPPVHHMYTKSPQQVEADKAAQTSMILGIIGLFLFGIVLGPLAIWQAKKAESMGSAATVGKVTGWIALIYNIIIIVGFIFLLILAAVATNQVGTNS